MRRFLIDTDTASDDAVALMMAFSATDVSVEAITIVAGNVGVEQASVNARFIAETCGVSVPVHAGCDRPWLRAVAPADWYHGKDGMGDQGYPIPQTELASQHAVDALLTLSYTLAGELELVTLGPLTNIATALAIDPTLATRIKHCWVMGGAACTHGNVTPAAEYNFWCDPEAAERVFSSGMTLTMIGWEHSCDAATLDAEERRDILALDTDRARIAIDSNATALQAAQELQAQSGLALADPVAMAVALDPSIATDIGEHAVQILCGDETVRGQSLVDKLGTSGRNANAHVVFAIDAPRWKALLRESLA
jgi:purine nucleosidase